MGKYSPFSLLPNLFWVIKTPISLIYIFAHVYMKVQELRPAQNFKQQEVTLFQVGAIWGKGFPRMHLCSKLFQIICSVHIHTCIFPVKVLGE